MGTWQITNWSRTDNRHNDNLWLESLDHSIATWMSTPTQWHMNVTKCVQCGDNVEHSFIDNRIRTVLREQWALDNPHKVRRGRWDNQATVCDSGQWFWRPQGRNELAHLAQQRQ
eukprot:4885462-Amphidinium_carterae.2